MQITYHLKKEQKETLKHLYEGRDTIGVFPTGFGKSIIFQLLPCLMQRKYSAEEAMIVFVVTPLNSIMVDQVKSLSEKKAISVCHIDFEGRSASTFRGADATGGEGSDSSESEAEAIADDSQLLLPTAVSLEDLSVGKYHLMYLHPETLHTPAVRKLLRSRLYQSRVCAIVVDEVHMVSEWGEEFRPAFKKIGDLTCQFPNSAHLALTATTTKDNITQLTNSLLFQNTVIVSANPDRSNIFINIKTRLPYIHKYETLDQLVQPLAEELLQDSLNFPVTIVYVENLEALGYMYQFIADKLGSRQYNGESKPENRIFAQFHTEYTKAMKLHIIQELQKENPKLRLVLATQALGMGLNSPSISRIIHSRPPTTLEAYVQQIGRAGRASQESEALMYFNNTDISKARKGLSEAVIRFCKNEQKTCLRMNLLNYFGYKEQLFAGTPHRCCSVCKARVETSL